MNSTSRVKNAIAFLDNKLDNKPSKPNYSINKKARTNVTDRINSNTSLNSIKSQLKTTRIHTLQPSNHSNNTIKGTSTITVKCTSDNTSDNINKHTSDNINKHTSDNINKRTSVNINKRTSVNINKRTSDNINKRTSVNINKRTSDNTYKHNTNKHTSDNTNKHTMDDNMPNITSISTQSHPIDCTHLPSTHSIQSAADIYPVNSTNNKTDIDILYEQIEDLTHERIEEPDLVNDLLVTYMTDNDDNALLQEHQSQIHALQQQLIECEQTTQQRMLYYVGELEKERLETKRLRSVLCKQDELISVIEKKLFGFIATSHSNDQELLQAQLDLQCIELEDHKKLVTILEIEKDGLLRQLQYIRKKRGLDDNEHPTYFYSHTQRSSIDLLADLAQSDLLLTHTHPSPPPSPPPSNPLPPLPTPQYSMPTPSSTNQTTPIPKSWSLLSFPNNKKASIIRRASKRISTAISHKEDVPLSSSTSTSSLSTLTKKLHLKYWK